MTSPSHRGAPRGGARTRLHVAALVLCAGLAGWGGPEGRPPLPSVDAAPPQRVRPLLDTPGVERVLAHWNPTLGTHERARIARAVMRYSAKYQLDPILVTAVIRVESRARPWVRSPKGAMGLMQVMPHVAAPLGLAGNSTTLESNVEAGCLILADNIRRLGEEDGISAYFWGSRIRGSAYLRRVRDAQAEVRRLLAES
ncbi:MAG: transglycosylase SLT domain-containing protein [Myxococcota bacterium]|nr:transglycosylase SLT domain-containing protein [Myxococcota bacterium]